MSILRPDEDSYPENYALSHIERDEEDDTAPLRAIERSPRPHHDHQGEQQHQNATTRAHQLSIGYITEPTVQHPQHTLPHLSSLPQAVTYQAPSAYVNPYDVEYRATASTAPATSTMALAQAALEVPVSSSFTPINAPPAPAQPVLQEPSSSSFAPTNAPAHPQHSGKAPGLAPPMAPGSFVSPYTGQTIINDRTIKDWDRLNACSGTVIPSTGRSITPHVSKAQPKTVFKYQLWCPICSGGPFGAIYHLKSHFPSCVKKYGNPAGVEWDVNVAAERGSRARRRRRSQVGGKRLPTGQVAAQFEAGYRAGYTAGLKRRVRMDEDGEEEDEEEEEEDEEGEEEEEDGDEDEDEDVVVG